MKRSFFVITFILAAFAVNAVAAARMQPDEVVSEIYNRFMKLNIKTMTYDEIRVSSYELAPQVAGKQQGTMPLNAENSSTMKQRYFYQAPDKHGYRQISEPMPGYWAGSPNQPGAIPMDQKWKDKVMSWYSVTMSPKDQVAGGAQCYVVTLSPKPDTPAQYPMTWYVDKDKFIVLKVVFLVNKGGKKVSATGEIKYKKYSGYYMPESSKWRTKVQNLPYFFLSNSTFSNYTFNEPIDPASFKEQFPDDWFEKLGEQPYKQ